MAANKILKVVEQERKTESYKNNVEQYNRATVYANEEARDEFVNLLSKLQLEE